MVRAVCGVGGGGGLKQVLHARTSRPGFSCGSLFGHYEEFLIRQWNQTANI